MTTDRDRVEAACRAYAGDREWADLPDQFKDLRRASISRALAAADALAPPPVPEVRRPYEAVRRFAQAILHGDEEHRAWLTEAAEAFIAGQSMPPPRGGGEPAPPVPEDVRQARDAYIAAPRESDEFGVAREHYFLTASNWIRTLLATPAPPADTGDEARAALEATEDETALANTDAAYERNRANAAEARLARARADALEEAAKVCDRWATFCGHAGDDCETKTMALWYGRKQYAERCAQDIRALADSEPASRSLASVRADALEEAAKVAEAQPYYYDTHTGMRQQWVKDEIARKVRALVDSEPAGRAAPDYEAAARFLFDLLDDIDTAEDVAKADDATFRKIAHRLHRRRFEVAETDGYKVTFKPAGRADQEGSDAR